MEELARAGSPVRAGTYRSLRHQDARQHAAHVGARPSSRRGSCRASLSGEDRWCQGFSEPGRGLRPRLADDPGAAGRAATGCIDGQKVWTSVAHTRPTGSSCWPAPTRQARGHRGLISFLLCPLETSRASRSGRSERSPGTAISTRCSSPAARTRAPVRAGRWPWPAARARARKRHRPDLFRAELTGCSRWPPNAAGITTPSSGSAGLVLRPGGDHALPRLPDSHPGARRAGGPWLAWNGPRGATDRGLPGAVPGPRPLRAVARRPGANPQLRCARRRASNPGPGQRNARRTMPA